MLAGRSGCLRRGRPCRGGTGARGNWCRGVWAFGEAKSVRFPLTSSFLDGALPRFSPEAELLGHRTPQRRVRRSYHRVITWQSPFLAVLIRRHPVGGAQMPLQELEFLPILQADEMIRLDRLLDRYSGCWRILQRLRAGEVTQCSVHRNDHLRDNFRRNAAVANEGGNNPSGHFYEFCLAGISHGSPGRLFRATYPNCRKHGRRIDGQQ